MSNKTTAEKIAVMQAYLDGKQIEILMPNGHWIKFDIPNPTWNWQDSDYRIKEEVVLYKRYLYKSQMDGKQYVHTHHKGLPSPEICSGFVRWIDNDWQTV